MAAKTRATVRAIPGPGPHWVLSGLRQWAQGAVGDEAAVELLASLGGRFTSTARPWVGPCRRPGWYWLDPEPITSYAGRLTDNQRRILALVAALLTSDPVPAAAPAFDAESRAAA